MGFETCILMHLQRNIILTLLQGVTNSRHTIVKILFMIFSVLIFYFRFFKTSDENVSEKSEKLEVDFEDVPTEVEQEQQPQTKPTKYALDIETIREKDRYEYTYFPPVIYQDEDLSYIEPYIYNKDALCDYDGNYELCCDYIDPPKVEVPAQEVEKIVPIAEESKGSFISLKYNSVKEFYTGKDEVKTSKQVESISLRIKGETAKKLHPYFDGNVDGIPRTCLDQSGCDLLKNILRILLQTYDSGAEASRQRDECVGCSSMSLSNINVVSVFNFSLMGFLHIHLQ